MRKIVVCSHCEAEFDHDLPDVSRAEADKLKAADNDKGVWLPCPFCQADIHLLMQDLPDLPEPQ